MRQGAGAGVLCKPAFRFSQFYLSKAVFQYIVRSPCFIAGFQCHAIQNRSE